MFDVELRQLKQDLARLDRFTPPHWSETKISGWGKGALEAEARRFLDPDWHKRDARTALLDIFQRAERAVDNHAQERQAAAQGSLHGENRVGVAEIAEAQRDDRDGVDELSPNETESIAEWFARLAKSVDFHDARHKPFMAALRGFASRYRGDALARSMDRKVVAAFLKKFCE